MILARPGRARCRIVQAGDRARRELAAGRDAEEVLSRFGHRLTNRPLHAPSMQVRRAAELTDDELMSAARRLLLDEPEDRSS